MVKIYICKGDKSSSHSILFDILLTHYNLNYCETDLKKTEYGKYYIDNCPVKFNISHSKDNIVIAVSDTEVGVDTEIIKDEFRVRRIFGVIPKTATQYAELWTKAEAVVKYRASSILLDLKKIDLSDSVKYDSVPLDVLVYTFIENDLVISLATTDTGYELVRI